ncbi:MAG: FtsX-like permease family protein [Pseudomonadota bacterium]
MTTIIQQVSELWSQDATNGIVPRSGINAALTSFSAAVMAFLAVFAIALSMAAGHLAQAWGSDLAGHATVRIVASELDMESKVDTVLDILETTPGVTLARALDVEEQRALLEPWFGPGLPLDQLSLPQLIEIHHDAGSFDAESFRLRLEETVPDAVFDDHARWQAPLATASSRLRGLAMLSVLLIAGVTAAVIALAAQGALAANAQVIGVLRLVGARDSFVEAAFVRRFTLRALAGAAAGGLVGALAVSILPGTQQDGTLLSGLGPSGWQWLWMLAVPPLTGAVAFGATLTAARRALRDLP